MEERGFLVYCLPEPNKYIYLKDCSVVQTILDSYKRDINDKKFNFSFDVVFTEDVRKAKIFLTRLCAMSTCDLLNSIFPADFKIGIN